MKSNAEINKICFNHLEGGELIVVKIRLRRDGAKGAPYYKIVVADARYPRDGRFIEEIGAYNPMKEPSMIVLDTEKYDQWVKNGARPTDTVKALYNKASKK